MGKINWHNKSDKVLSIFILIAASLGFIIGYCVAK